MESLVGGQGFAKLPVHSVEDRTIPTPIGPIPVRVYQPSDATNLPVLVFFHGGGWVACSLNTHDQLCRLLCDNVGCVVLSVDYRLAPETKFPGAVDDCVAAYDWATRHADEIGGDKARIAIGGDSAGGNLAAVMSQLARDGGPAIRFQLLIYPVTDHEFTSVSMEENAEGYYLTRDAMRWFYDHYLNDPAEGDDPRVSPRRATDLAGLPPAFVLTAQYDPLRDQGMAYADALHGAGNVVAMTMYEGLFHGFFSMFDLIDAGKAAFDDAIAAVVAAVG
jgi:acetyl esterase